VSGNQTTGAMTDATAGPIADQRIGHRTGRVLGEVIHARR